MRAATAAGVVAAAALATWAAVPWWRTAAAPGAASDVTARGATDPRYQCSMHPHVVAGEPGQCPVCGMALSRVEPTARAVQEHGTASAAPPSRASFTLSSARQQAVGIATTAIEYRELHRELRAAGRVAFDPNLYAALAEHRELTVARDGLQAAASDEARRRVDALWRASTLRLSLLGISSSELAAIAQAGDATSLLLPGRSAWVYATVFGAQLGSDPDGLLSSTRGGLEPRVGHPVRVTSRALPGRVLRGTLVTVEPIGGAATVASTRDLRVRALVETPGGGLGRGGLVDLVVEIPLGRRLAIPDDAVLDTGTQQIAFVRHDGGRFEPRDVVLGVDGERYREVLAGLAAGEQVVSAATFLVDSESRFRAGQDAFAVRGADGDDGHANGDAAASR